MGEKGRRRKEEGFGEEGRKRDEEEGRSKVGGERKRQ